MGRFRHPARKSGCADRTTGQAMPSRVDMERSECHRFATRHRSRNPGRRLPNRHFRTPRAALGRRRRRSLLRPANPPPTGRRTGQPSLRLDRGPSALPLPRPASRRLPPLLSGKVHQALPRLDGFVQTQHLPLASDRRPGLAYRDQTLPAPDRDRRLSNPNPDRRIPRRPDHLRTRPLRRVLHAGRDPRSGSLCRRTAHRCHSRDRNARSRDGRPGRLSRTSVRPRPEKFRDERTLGRPRRCFLPGQRADLRISRRRAGRSAGTLPVEAHPHRRRRVSPRTLEGVPRLPGPHGGRRDRGRSRTANLPDPPHRPSPRSQGPPADRLGRDSRRRAGSRRRGDELARHQGRNRRRTPPARSDHDTEYLPLFRQESHRFVRRTRQSEQQPPAAGKNLRLRSGRRDRTRRPALPAGRTGQPVDRIHPNRRARELPAPAAHLRAGRNRMVARRAQVVAGILRGAPSGPPRTDRRLRRALPPARPSGHRGRNLRRRKFLLRHPASVSRLQSPLHAQRRRTAGFRP